MSETTAFDQINEQYEIFSTEHAKFAADGNKAAAQRARKAIGEIKKLATVYRKDSVQATKG